MNHWWNSFCLALSFLTRIPIPELKNINDQQVGYSLLFYPLIGLLLGVMLWLIPTTLWWLQPIADPMLLAVLMVIFWAAITGGLHLDGLADSADAWLGGQGNEEKTHRILKDSYIGAAGVVAIVCILLLKFVALSSLLSMQSGWLIIFVPLTARALVLLLFLTTPYVRKDGLGSLLIAHLPHRLAWAVLASCLALLAVQSIMTVILVLGLFWLLRRMMLRYLRGCTGDTAGAMIEISEAGVMVFFVLLQS